MSNLKGLTLDNIASGATAEIFQRELGIVLENINDPNTKPDTVREITLTFAIRPDPYRETAAIVVSAKTKLSPVKGAAGIAYFGKTNGRLAAYSHNVNQTEMNVEIGPEIVSEVADGE